LEGSSSDRARPRIFSRGKPAPYFSLKSGLQRGFLKNKDYCSIIVDYLESKNLVCHGGGSYCPLMWLLAASGQSKQEIYRLLNEPNILAPKANTEGVTAAAEKKFQRAMKIFQKGGFNKELRQFERRLENYYEVKFQSENL
jgi:hypothetical protein